MENHHRIIFLLLFLEDSIPSMVPYSEENDAMSSQNNPQLHSNVCNVFPRPETDSTYCSTNFTDPQVPTEVFKGHLDKQLNM